MKVQILALDPQDDRASIADRLAWAQAPRVLLVWPRSGRPRLRRLDLTLLQRQARRRGVALALATTDPDLRELASDLGIPAFDTPDRADEQAWVAAEAVAPLPKRAAGERPAPSELRRSGLKRGPRRAAGRVARAVLRALLFALALASVAALALVAWPSAEITLVPVTTVEVHDLELTLDPQAGVLAAGLLPARPAYAVVEGSLRVPTTGASAVASERARTTIVFTNLTEALVVVPQGTGLRAQDADGTRFLTLESVALEPGGTASVLAEAAEPGPQANLPAGQITRVEGPLGLQVSVASPEPAVGGAESLRPAVDPADVRSAERQLRASLLEQAVAETEAGLSGGSVVAPASARVARELGRGVDADVGQPADSVEITLELEVELLIYAEADLAEAVQAALTARSQGLLSVPGSEQAEVVGGTAPDAAGRARLRVRVTRAAFEPVEGAALTRRLLGQTPQQAAALLAEAVDLAQPPEIRLRPSWFPRLPLVATRIALRWPWGTP